MKSSRKCKVTAAFLAAAALGGVAYAAPILTKKANRPNASQWS